MRTIALTVLFLMTGACAPAVAAGSCTAYYAAQSILFRTPYHKHTTTPGRTGGAYVSDEVVVGGKH